MIFIIKLFVLAILIFDNKDRYEISSLSYYGSMGINPIDIVNFLITVTWFLHLIFMVNHSYILTELSVFLNLRNFSPLKKAKIPCSNSALCWPKCGTVRTNKKCKSPKKMTTISPLGQLLPLLFRMLT
jgi:hypothetical protein